MKNMLRRVRISVSVSALIALLLGLSLSGALFAGLRQLESARHNRDFQRSASAQADAVTGGLSDAVEQLMVVNQLFRSMDSVSREQFHEFTAPLLARHPAIQALSFQRLVRQADRRDFERAMQPRFPGFQIEQQDGAGRRRAETHDSYNVVDFIEPAQGNQAVFGLDFGAAPAQAAARRLSRANGQLSATALLSLPQQRGWHTGFMVLAPVYQRGAALDTVAARERAVIGETSAMFRIDGLIRTLLDQAGFDAGSGMAIRVYAGPGDDAALLAFQRGETGTGAMLDMPPHASLLPSWLWFDQAAPLARRFDLAGREWHMTVSQADRPVFVMHSSAVAALLGGILCSLLAAAWVYALVSRKSEVERLTDQRTAALRFANLRLTEDLAARLRKDKQPRLRERAIDMAPNAVLICSALGPDYPIEYVNAAFETITGYAAGDVIGRSLESLQDSQYQQDTEEIRGALRDKRLGHARLRNYRKDGALLWSDLFIAPVQDGDGAVSHFVVAQYDITASMHFEAELAFQARHDALTGLANRTLLRERLAQAVADADRTGIALWLVFVDLDRFKFVNDTLGHEAGDMLLKVLAGRLQSASRETDTVARLGGDEFVLVLPGKADHAAGLAVLQAILDAVAQPLVIRGHEFFLTCSIGVAIHPSEGASADQLIQHADIAMYRAKEAGRNNYQFYTDAMSQSTLDRLGIEADLRHALERGQFELHYQPQLDLVSGRMVGMEALLRWRHPVHGMIAPARFIRLAEEMGLINQIGAWVIRTACRQNQAWQLAGLGSLRVAVNLSPRQFRQPSLLQSIVEALEESGMEARFLELELTESMVMDDVEQAIDTLTRLKSLGLHISIDDFGTGYSSLSYLRRFPIDVLKIDRSFIHDLSDDESAASIVIAIVTLAHSLHLQVIAEGVETAAQLAFLRGLGCDQMQGFYFSRPLAAAAFELLLRAGNGLAPATPRNDAPDTQRLRLHHAPPVQAPALRHPKGQGEVG